MRLRLTLGSGAWGEGEAAPLEGISSDDIESAWAAALTLSRKDLELPAVPRAGALPDGLPPSLMFALETAWLNAAARTFDRTIIEMLGGDARRRFSVNGVVDRLGAEGVGRARALMQDGFRCLKVKVGRPASTDAELVLLDGLVREVSSPLRLDANGRAGTALVDWARSAAERGQLEYFEEPGRPALGVPVARDESLAAEPEPPRLDCDVVVLKPTILGGLFRARRFAEAARRSRIDVVVTHAIETGPGFDACVALAAVLGSPRRAQGVAPHGLLRPGLRPWVIRQGVMRWKTTGGRS